MSVCRRFERITTRRLLARVRVLHTRNDHFTRSGGKFQMTKKVRREFDRLFVPKLVGRGLAAILALALFQGRAAAQSLTCTTVQRGVFGTVADTTVKSYEPNAVSGARDEMRSIGSPFQSQALIMFDLGFIPAGVRVTSAVLTLQAQMFGGVLIRSFASSELLAHGTREPSLGTRGPHSRLLHQRLSTRNLAQYQSTSVISHNYG